MIKLFESTTTSFLNNGLGVLNAIKCIEYKKKSLNGWYIECEFPIEYKDRIVQDAILYVETKEKGGQPFRCNNPKYKDSKIIVTANHVIFDSENYLLEDVRPTDLSPVGFLNWINERTDITSPFTVSSNVSGSGTKYFVRKSLLDAFKETEELFGGSYDVDSFHIALKSKVGNDDGYSIAYGKNLQSISIVEDWSTVCTKLLAVGPNGLVLPETYLYSDVQYDKPYSKVIEFSFDTSYEDEDGNTIEYTNDELIERLRTLAEEYMIDAYVPKINYSVKSDVPQSLCIGDVIRVKHPIVTISTEVQSYSYNVISKRVLSIEFGNYERNVKKLFDSLKQTVEQANSAANSSLSIANKQTDLINNLNKTGLVYIDENEILVLDTLPKEEAVNVWRFGLGGIGFSSNGYKGPYEYAFTQDGYFNTNFIKANSITVNHLAADVGSSLDLSSNETINLTVSRIESLENEVKVTNISSQWGLSPSKTVVPTEWSDTQLERTSSTYLWMREKYTYSDGSVKFDGERMISADDGKDGEDVVLLQILSSNGAMFKNSAVATTLTVSLIVAGKQITSSSEMYEQFGSDAQLIWQQKRFGETEYEDVDPSDSRLSDNGFIFTISASDLKLQTVFNCSLDY